MFRKIVLLIIIAICLSGCAAAPEEALPPDTATPEPPPTDAPTPEPAPTDTPSPEPGTLEEINVVFDDETSTLEQIVIVFKNLFPGDFEYDENGERFLLGSMSQGTIYQIFENGTFESFIEDPDLIESYVLEIDRNNQRLLVVNNDQSQGTSYLYAFDLSSGDRIFRSEISSIQPDLPHFASDVTVDAAGIAYVTDIDSDAIYRVDLEGNPSLFLEDTQFSSLSNIVYHPTGFLLLASYPGAMFGEFKLLKIPLDTQEVIEVEITEGYWGFMKVDSMILHPDGTLIMVTYPGNDTGRLQSDDDWDTAQFVARSIENTDGWGSRIALRGEEIYVINSNLALYREGSDQNEFVIYRVTFE